MAYQTKYDAVSALSVIDFTADSQKFVTLDATGRINLIPTALTKAFGVLENEPNATGMPGTVSYLGITKLRVDSTAYAVGSYLKPLYSATASLCGIGTTCAMDSTREMALARAITLETADGTNNCIVAVRLIN
jgi:hypothetical protein